MSRDSMRDYILFRIITCLNKYSIPMGPPGDLVGTIIGYACHFPKGLLNQRFGIFYRVLLLISLRMSKTVYTTVIFSSFVLL